MKPINTFISEKLKITKPKEKVEHTLFPTSKTELRQMIINELKQNRNECNLNHIDTSKITNMSYLFYSVDFDGDISEWNVSNVEDMAYMFLESVFNQDISEWDVSNVKTMDSMFKKSKFNDDISKWDVSKVNDMEFMFCGFQIEM